MTKHTRYHCGYCGCQFDAGRTGTYLAHLSLHVLGTIFDQTEYCTHVWECDECRLVFENDDAYAAHECTGTYTEWVFDEPINGEMVDDAD